MPVYLPSCVNLDTAFIKPLGSLKDSDQTVVFITPQEEGQDDKDSEQEGGFLCIQQGDLKNLGFRKHKDYTLLSFKNFADFIKAGALQSNWYGLTSEEMEQMPIQERRMYEEWLVRE